ncbi:MAG: hypothetical protein DWH91_08985 [Planctomycetota bacterium]|nr:MAG: hypothetical protein DWH91_08985 [Planctomycetota bacterium]
MSFRMTWIASLLLLFTMSVGIAEDAAPAGPALTRPEMKQRIEALKTRTSRLPLPALTADELASGRRSVNNGRLRSIYLPESWQSSSSSRGPRGAVPTGIAATLNTLQQSPDYGFKTRLFWIVSRTNDCQYCLGHQELKLRRVGMTDDQIASLDVRWDLFPDAEQAAMQATRQLTMAPHRFGDAERTLLKKHFTDSEIIDIVQTVARYNATNRWTASTGIPQDQSFGGDEPSQLDTPTSAEFSRLPSRVAPVDYQPRPEWEAREAVDAALAIARHREPAVELPSMEIARQVLAADTPGAIPPVWFQAMANLPTSLASWKQRQALVRDGQTAPELRVLIEWVTARENRAWYAAGHAQARYVALGRKAADLDSYSQLESLVTPAQAEALRFVRRLTSAPHTIGDADIARLREQFTDHEVAEIIQLTSEANAFSRFTEALQLPLEN